MSVVAPDPVELLRELIRFDTTNPPGREAAAVAHVDAVLRAAGISTRLLESAPGRPNLVARLPGRGVAPPLLMQAHVDVVPADPAGWTHPPFDATVADGFVWGRGALDMKSGLAMMVTALVRAVAAGFTPPGDVILAVLADEEAGGDHGARFLVDKHPELFAGVRYALGEFGGFTLDIAGTRSRRCRCRRSRSASWSRPSVGPAATARSRSAAASRPGWPACSRGSTGRGCPST